MRPSALFAVVSDRARINRCTVNASIHPLFLINRRVFSMSQHRDIAGTVCSGLCLCHCLAAPLLAAVGGMGAFGALIADKRVHWLLTLSVWLLALTSFPRAYRRHGRVGPLLYAGAGVLAVTLALFGESHWETTITVTGSLCLVYAHISNRRHMAGLVADA